jgi:membrane AbrB-like protein
LSPRPSAAAVALRTGLTIAIAAAGGLAAQLTGLPAGWLLGGAVAVAAAALCGVKVMLPNWLRDLTFLGTGLSMGANVSRDSLSLIGQWPVTMAALAIELLLIIGVTGYLLQRVFGLDRGTAYLSSFPGHLSFTMSIAAAGVGDARQIVIIQVIRILILTICVPVAALFLPIEATTAATAAVPPIPAVEIIGVGLCCAVAGFVFTRLGVPAGYVLGAMAVSMVARFAGVFDGAMPTTLQTVIFVMVAAVIGSRFHGITLTEFRKAAAGGVVGTVITAIIATTAAVGAAFFVDMPIGQIWLGLSPGGLESMGALGIALGYDTAFIAAHHVSRLLMLTAAIPTVAMMLRPKGDDRQARSAAGVQNGD